MSEATLSLLTNEQAEYVCIKDSQHCSYTWNVADYETVNYTVSVAPNNVVGQGVTKNCTTTPIGEQLPIVATGRTCSDFLGGFFQISVHMSNFIDASLFSGFCAGR